MKRLSSVPAGWSLEMLRVVGRGIRIGQRHGLFGEKPGLACGRLPGSREPFVAIGCGGGYLLFYADPLGRMPELAPRRVGNLNEREPLGAWDSALNSQFYPSFYPLGKGALAHVVAGRSLSESLEYCRKLDASPRLDFFWHTPFLRLAGKGGKPAAIDWNRNGRFDLLVGEEDGFLRRYRRRPGRRFAFNTPGEVVTADGAPIRFAGWLYPCVVDWDGTGRSDLLLGTAAGDVWLFRDIGGKRAVAFDRGRVIHTLAGRLNVGSFAVPAALGDRAGRFTHLLVMNGRGELFAHAMEAYPSYVVADWPRALRGQPAVFSRSFQKGAWLLGRPSGLGRGILTTIPAYLAATAPRLTLAQATGNVVPPLDLNPGLRGNYEVHLGLFQPPAWPQFPFLMPPHVQVRPARAAAAEMVFAGEYHRLPRQEVFAGIANLTNARLAIEQTRGNYLTRGGYPCGLEYVRLVPVRKVRKKARPPAPPAPAVVSAIFDTFDWTLFVRTDEEAEVRDMIAKHRLCGFNRIYYKAGGGCCEYPSGVPGSESLVDYPGARVKKRWPQEDFAGHFNKLNRFRLAARYCREQGIECYAWVRITNTSEHLGYGYPLFRFFVEHPRMRNMTRYGTPLARLSLSFPEVQAYFLRLFAEWIGFGVKGILVDFLRTMPTLSFPADVVRRFRKRYGCDPRVISPADARLLRAQAGPVTAFLRKTRALLRRDGVARELHVRIDGLGIGRGLDPAAWVGKKLVDALIIEDCQPDPREPDLAAALALCRGSPCRVIAGFYRPTWGRDHAHPIHPEIIRDKAAHYTAMGAHGLSFYESAEILKFPEMRRAIRSLTDPDVQSTIRN